MKHRICKSLLTTTSIVVLIAAMASIASCSSEATIPKSKEDKLLEEYEPFIRDYLTERYGEGVGKDAEIEVEIPDEYVFEVHTPVLSYSTFEVRPVVPDSAEECVFTDDLLTRFWCQQDFRADFLDYVHDELELPDNILVSNIVLDSFDFEGYIAGDDYTARFDSTEYHVIIVTWVLDEFDESEAETYMEEFYYNYFPMLFDSLGDNALTVYFEVAGEVDYESAFYRGDNNWGGPDATLYAYRESGLESVDSYYFDQSN